MIKLIASDLDGTLLLNGAQILNPKVYDFVSALKKKGISFIAASGRQVDSLRHLFGPIADEISYIAENGAICVYNDETFVTSEIERSLSLRIIDSIQRRAHCNLMVSGVSTCYIPSGNEEFSHHVFNELNYKAVIIDDFSEIQEPIVKIATQDHINYEDSANYFHNKFQKEIKVVTSGNGWVDFMPYGCNKGIALQIMLTKLGIHPNNVVVFGDQQNDLEMLKLAGTSYAMAASPPEVKKYASHVTDSVEKVLKEILTSC